ncbi:SPP1 family predicted phage head-tail adaptor [Paraburkholderia youngii]|uniref:phage head closure protein n=1 Tax=Paraburkholderia youngii TaxID=2782701 RepID=UPI003D1E4902
MPSYTSGADAGALDARITLEEPVVEVDPETGEPMVTEWLHVADVWASIRVTGGVELYASDQWRGERTTRIYIRKRKGVTNQMRVLHDDTVYNIEAVSPVFVQRRALLELRCDEGMIRDGGQP